ncbi:MAG TPA: MerR family transcriptional regulator [Longimicrobiales bacterium]|nr:MerR family transcriptional regulator [Longimicrobiales bacterium]
MNENDERQEHGGALHPIGVVARRTGVSLHVLRAWERRYGVVQPRRTSGGQRLYSDADVARLRVLRQLTESGRSISQVATLPMAELERLAAEDVRSPEPQEHGVWYRSRSIAAAERLDGEAVYATLMRAVVSLRPGEFMDEVLLPLLREVGEKWHQGQLSPAQEHVVSVAARRVVTWLLAAYEAPAGSPVMLVTTVEGEQHEFGALMVNVVALDEGWRVTYLGTSLPASEVVNAALEVGATLVALSVVTDDDGDRMVAEVARIRAALPATVGVVVGGAGAAARRTDLEEAGVQLVADAAELRVLLRSRQPALPRGGA